MSNSAGEYVLQKLIFPKCLKLIFQEIKNREWKDIVENRFLKNVFTLLDGTPRNRKAKLADQFHLLGYRRVLRHKPFSENFKIIIGSGHFGVRGKITIKWGHLIGYGCLVTWTGMPPCCRALPHCNSKIYLQNVHKSSLPLPLITIFISLQYYFNITPQRTGVRHRVQIIYRNILETPI